MTSSPSVRTWPLRALTALVGPLVLALASCGGGGGGGSGGGSDDDDPPPPAPASLTRVVIQPTSQEEFDELIEETGATVIGPVEGTTFWVVELPAGMTTEEFLAELEEDARVEEADEDEGVQFPEGGASTIPIFEDEPVASVAIQPALGVIGVPDAHTRSTGAGVLVAVIDTGVIAHPLLAGRLAPGGRDFVDGDADPTDAPNGLDDDADGKVDEGVGHGTFVASLVLAVAPDARILAIRALNSDATGTASTVANAIAYALSQGADVINLSAGLVRSTTMIQQAVANAKAAGVPVVAAAGNRQASVDFPAFLSDAAAVTSVELSGVKASFASYGSSVDVSAPGVDLLGAFPPSPSGVARWSGTSFSTALVSGGFALLRQLDPVGASEDLLKRLGDTALSVDAQNPSYDGRLGKGRIDLAAATMP